MRDELIEPIVSWWYSLRERRRYLIWRAEVERENAATRAAQKPKT